jgi:hypothetical protein
MTSKDHKILIIVNTDKIMELDGNILDLLDEIRVDMFSAGLNQNEKTGMVKTLENMESMFTDLIVKSTVLREDLQKIERKEAVPV